MTSYSRSLIVLSVAAALAVPATVAAQTAIPRTSGGSSSSGSSGGGTSSGGGGGDATSSSGSSREPSRVSLPPSPSTDSRRRSGSATSSSDAPSRPTSTMTGRPLGSSGRTSGTSGGGDYTGMGGSRTGSAITRGSAPTAAAGGSISTYGGSRPRGDRPVTGEATERPEGLAPGYNLYVPIDNFGPWGRWYPWYYGGYGYGYVSYDPWRYGVSRYSIYRYGSWYDPYDPWCYNVGYWRCDGTAGYGATTSAPEDEGDVPMASVRLRVSPASAQVYLNGALVGIVSDFSGLSNHLEVPINAALIEIKADGYQTFVPEVEITAGRTTTVRGSLKKQ